MSPENGSAGSGPVRSERWPRRRERRGDRRAPARAASRRDHLRTVRDLELRRPGVQVHQHAERPAVHVEPPGPGDHADAPQIVVAAGRARPCAGPAARGTRRASGRAGPAGLGPVERRSRRGSPGPAGRARPRRPSRASANSARRPSRTAGAELGVGEVGEELPRRRGRPLLAHEQHRRERRGQHERGARRLRGRARSRRRAGRRPRGCRPGRGPAGSPGTGGRGGARVDRAPPVPAAEASTSRRRAGTPGSACWASTSSEPKSP